MKSRFDINVVLIEPEIPQNTGNIGRTCLGFGASLHLVGKLGFELDEKNVKRAGLDYWEQVPLTQHKDWESFKKTIDGHLYFFSTKGKTNLHTVSFKTPAYLVFGSESRGLPPSLFSKVEDKLVRIPTTHDIRSLNLATSVGIAVYEASRSLTHVG